MATLSHFLSFSSLSSRNLHCFGDHQYRPSRRDCSVCACSIRKSSASRKTKSNEELCKEIREFVKSVGFPEDHVPSTKELSQHGRIDLANIVRRRGHKLMRELLITNSNNTVESDLESITLTGQGSEARDVTKYLSLPNEDLVLENVSPTVIANSSVQGELLNDLECYDGYESHREKEKVEVEEDSSLKTEGNASEVCFSSSNVSSDDKCNDNSMEPTEFSNNLSVEKPENSLDCLREDRVQVYFPSPNSLSGENYTTDSAVNEYLDLHDYDDESLVEKVDNNVDGVSLSAEMTIVDEQSNDLNTDRALEREDSSCTLIKYSEELSLAEKVARFIQNGVLDTTDDNFDAVSSESDAGKNNVSFTEVNAEETKENSHYDACSEDTESRVSLMVSNGSALEFDRIEFSTTVGQLIRDDQSSTKAVNDQVDEVLSVERERNENQVEIDRLKLILHQKELELSQLKEQLKRDQFALSALQTKAETEVTKTQKLILEKDSELLAAEESLSGLEEVHIHYRGEGEIIEVAGSFNGWHHKIKMDPQPSSDVVASVNSKNHRLWSTVLWLYPGVYEIKFVVDGHWKIDPHRESVTYRTISNNIIRVGR